MTDSFTNYLSFTQLYRRFINKYLIDFFGDGMDRGKEKVGCTLSYVMVCLLGRFKGEHYHLTPMASKMASGLEIRK